MDLTYAKDANAAYNRGILCGCEGIVCGRKVALRRSAAGAKLDLLVSLGRHCIDVMLLRLMEMSRDSVFDGRSALVVEKV
jgi:hypothetical protein